MRCRLAVGRSEKWFDAVKWERKGFRKAKNACFPKTASDKGFGRFWLAWGKNGRFFRKRGKCIFLVYARPENLNKMRENAPSCKNILQNQSKTFIFARNERKSCYFAIWDVWKNVHKKWIFTVFFWKKACIFHQKWLKTGQKCIILVKYFLLYILHNNRRKWNIWRKKVQKISKNFKKGVDIYTLIVYNVHNKIKNHFWKEKHHEKRNQTFGSPPSGLYASSRARILRQGRQED